MVDRRSYSSWLAFLNTVRTERFEQVLGRDVDLLIRSGGEKRLSDFLLWECAYAELFFSDRMWLAFGAEDLATAVNDFRKRERRFGGVGPARKGRASVVCSATLAPKTFCSPECVI